MSEGLLTAERERNLRRDHARLHPDGLMRSGRLCDVCLLLAALTAARRRLPRCNGTTGRGYRCAQGAGHRGPHTHPNDDARMVAVCSCGANFDHTCTCVGTR